MDIPAAVHFVSVEPILEKINLSDYIDIWNCFVCGYSGNLTGSVDENDEGHSPDEICCPKCGVMEGFGEKVTASYDWPNGIIDWVIVGAETGPKARNMNPKWAHSLYKQCKSARVPFFFKKWSQHRVKRGGHIINMQETANLEESVVREIENCKEFPV